MPYEKSTASSRNRARASLATSRLGEKPSDHPTSHYSTARLRKASSDVTKHPRAYSRTGGNSHLKRRVRTEVLAAQQRLQAEAEAEEAEEEEQLRLSQELTSQCEAVTQRVNTLLDKAQMQEERINRTLRESLERSPLRSLSRSPKRAIANSLSPHLTSTARTPTGSFARWSGILSTPQAPKVPPPTPAHPNAVEASAATSGWVSKMLGRSPEVPVVSVPKNSLPQSYTPKAQRSSRSPRPADDSHSGHSRIPGTSSPPPMLPGEKTSVLQRLIGRYTSSSPPPPPNDSPRRSRKSVAFKDSAEVGTNTFPELAEKAPGNGEPEPRGSLVYPPAPPPSEKKSSRRSISPSEEDEAKPSVSKGDVLDVGHFIREHSQNRALRDLTKADLLAYAKQHQVTLSASSTKRELLEVARRLAKGDLDNPT